MNVHPGVICQRIVMGPPPRRSNNRQKSTESVDSSLIALEPKVVQVIRHKGYSLSKKLGAGAFGTVYKATKTDGSQSAVKVLDYSKMSKIVETRFLPREIEALSKCKHESVIEVFDIFRAGNRLFIFMEFAGGGDISGALKKSNGSGLGLKKAASWFLQISNGLAYIHDEVKMCHRDIKVDNFLLNEQQKAKLSDFGFAKCVVNEGDETVVLTSTFCGTLPYEAPQVLARQKYNGFKYDIWSMGVSLFVMLTARFPFHHKNPTTNKSDLEGMLNEQRNHPEYILSRTNELNIGSKGQELFTKLLNPVEEKRPMMSEVVENGWLQRVCN